ncbi:putative bifunctional diguanylate cyclase/phosphodiesterase [Cupriavidus sp. D39]|uniref:putative bifunctional diguanylate cyclase/phosphodiesterase n=1 Tax=Cupriavidus sp. D39 TaxID=2997877 RepID=UPI002271B043|nr:EAL domain-containing protein [Cupriavidus sp. D39]MCY0853541.1 EAL domain-containing protein [Cupriavidus sp. D39]
MSADAAERIRLDQALRGAMERDEFELHYQPQIDLRSGGIAGVEALIRWHQPELGLVSPARFIPLAEETGLIVPLGDWVMRTACAQMAAWQQAGLAPPRIAVNLSARQLWQGHAAERVAAVLCETGIPAGCLEVEITESVVMRDGAEAVQALSALRALGVTLALDDFGTGYSSLSHLRSLPLNKLKIDRAFIQDLTTRSDVAVLVQQIIQIGHAFKLRVVAEGVETRETADLLARSGCDEVQGFYFGKPLPAQDLEALLRQHSRRPSLAAVKP